MLTIDEICQFQKITMDVYGIELNEAEARDQGERLLRIIELMAQTLKPEDLIYKAPVEKGEPKR